MLKCTTNPDETELTLHSALPPGQTIDLSIDLTSPAECGSFQRKYRMYTPHGQLFGGKLDNIKLFFLCTALNTILQYIDSKLNKPVLFINSAIGKNCQYII